MKRAAVKTCLAASGLLTALPLLTAQAQAQDLSYTYVELGYVQTDIDGVGKDLEGFALRGSYEVADNVFLYARYVDQSVSTAGSDFDVTRYALGAGLAWSFAQNMDLYGRLGYVEAEFDGPGGFGFDDDGFELGVGVRARPIELLELEGAINYVDLSDSGDDTSYGLAGRWFITDAVALGVEAEFADDADTYGVGFRWQF